MPDPIIPNVPQQKTETVDPVKLVVPGNASTVDAGMLFDIQKLAHEALPLACAEIADRIKEFASSGRLVLMDRQLRDGLDLYAATFEQLDQLAASFESVRKAAENALAPPKSPPPESPPPNSGVVDAQGADSGISLSPVQTALDLLGAVSQESQFFGRTVKISDEAMLFALADSLRNSLPQGQEIFFPALFAPLTTPSAVTASAKLRQSFDRAMAARSAAFSTVSRLQVRAAKAKEADPSFHELQFAANRVVSAYDTSDILLRELNARLGTKDPSTGLTGFQALLRAAAVQDILDKGREDCRFLYVNVEAAGGSYRIVKGLVRLLSGEDGVDATGGVVLSFGLFRSDGVLQKSGIVTKQTEFRNLSPVDQGVFVMTLALLLAIAFIGPEVVRSLAK